jgi:hypothetical protein
MTPHDDSAWDDLSEALGLETKPKPKPYDPVPAGFASQQTPGEPLPYPANPWPEDPSPDASGVLGFAELPDAQSSDDENDTLIEPMLANEEFAGDEDESAEGESDSDSGQPGGKKKRRRRRRRKGGGNQDGTTEGSGSEESEHVEEREPEQPRSVADAIRHVVANWTVPGWKDIVAGLYRPGGSPGQDRGDRERDR